MERTELWSMQSQRGVPMWLAALALLLVATRIVVVARSEKTAPPPIERSLVKWVPLEQGRQRANASHKRILYDFSAAWCGPCREMNKRVFSDPALAGRINRDFIPVQVVDRQQEDGRNPAIVEQLQQRYRIRAFPTIVIADSRDTQKSRLEGFRGPDSFDSLLTQGLH
jgi:thiol:disulfide interchange protein